MVSVGYVPKTTFYKSLFTFISSLLFMARIKATPKRKAPQPRRVTFQTLPADAGAPPVAAAFAPPSKRYSDLASEPTWMNMMSSLRTKYNVPRKTKRKKKEKKNKKKKKPTKADKKAYQAALRNMTLKQKRRNRTGAMSMTLMELVRAFPGAAHKLQVYLNRSTLNSLVSNIPGAKKKVGTFLS